MNMSPEEQAAYLNDPPFHALIKAVFHRTIEWERTFVPVWRAGPARSQAEQHLVEDYVRLLFVYHKHLRESNARLMAEVIRLKSLVSEPMLIGNVPLQQFTPEPK